MSVSTPREFDQQPNQSPEIKPNPSRISHVEIAERPASLVATYTGIARQRISQQVEIQLDPEYHATAGTESLYTSTRFLSMVDNYLKPEEKSKKSYNNQRVRIEEHDLSRIEIQDEINPKTPMERLKKLMSAAKVEKIHVVTPEEQIMEENPLNLKADNDSK